MKSLPEVVPSVSGVSPQDGGLRVQLPIVNRISPQREFFIKCRLADIEGFGSVSNITVAKSNRPERLSPLNFIQCRDTVALIRELPSGHH